MFCACATFVVTIGGLGALAWLALKRLAPHLRKHPEAVKAIYEHLVTPLLLGDDAPQEAAPPAGDEAKPEPKKIKATLI